MVFAEEEIINDPREDRFTQGETADVILGRVGREEVSALASGYACNELIDTERRKIEQLLKKVGM